MYFPQLGDAVTIGDMIGDMIGTWRVVTVYPQTNRAVSEPLDQFAEQWMTVFTLESKRDIARTSTGLIAHYREIRKAVENNA